MKAIFFYLSYIFQWQCVAYKDYTKNRVHDAIDIFNLGVEENVYGGGIYMDSIMLGLAYNVGGKGYGLRFGHFGKYLSGDKDAREFLYSRAKEDKCERRPTSTGRFANIGDSFLIYASNYHRVNEKISIRNAEKKIGFFTLWFAGNGGKMNLRICYKDQENTMFTRDSYVVLPMEVSLGLYYGIRLGFNPHELLDFMVGIFGFDLLDDDTTTVYSELPRSVERNQAWEKDFEEVDMEMGIRIKREREEQEKIKGFK